MHIHQKKILKLLVEKGPSKYSQLHNAFDPDARFSYHLKQLIEEGFVIKSSDLYDLTPEGVRLSVNYHSSPSLETILHKIPRLLFVIEKDETFLIKEYFKENGTERRYGLPGKSLPFDAGEMLPYVYKTLNDFYKIIGDIHYRCIQSCIMRNETEETLYDFLYVIFDVKVKEEYLHHEQYEYLTLEEIKNLPNRMSVIDDFILNDWREAFTERTVIVTSSPPSTLAPDQHQL